MSTDELYMQRCLLLAQLGLGNVKTNPLVGCVIVHNETIIGEGHHSIFGGAHAEVDAIQKVKDQNLLPEATLYVNLEPCSHYGKTPPCSDLIIEKKIPRVVIGMKDPFSKVNGSGIAALEKAGIVVKVGILEEECQDVNKRFISFQKKERPYLILKWAETADGFIGKERERIKISNSAAQVLTHKWRSEEMGILISAKTALTDDPELTNRYWKGHQPTKIIVDRSGALEEKTHLKVLNSSEMTYVFTSYNYTLPPPTKVIQLPADGHFLKNMLKSIKDLGINSCLMEGGATLHQAFIAENYWDEARIFTSDTLLKDGIKAPVLKANSLQKTMLGNNSLKIIINQEKQ